MSTKLINLSQQDLQIQSLYEGEGLPPETIADALELKETVVRASLMTNSAIYRRAYADGAEDISDDMFEQVKDVVFEIAVDKTMPAYARLNAAKFVWERKRPVKQVADGGLAEFAKMLGEGIVAARGKAARILATPEDAIEIPAAPKEKITDIHNAVAADMLRSRANG